jgi:cell division protein FtsL
MRGWAGVQRVLGRLAAATRRRRIVVFVSVLTLVATLAAIFVSRQFTIDGLRRETTRLEQEQTQAEARQKELRTEVASTTSPKRLEEEARKRLGLVSPGEEKVFFIEEGSP